MNLHRIIKESLRNVIVESQQAVFSDMAVGDTVYRINSKDRSLTPERLQITRIEQQPNQFGIYRIYLADGTDVELNTDNGDENKDVTYQTIYDNVGENIFHTNIIATSERSAVWAVERFNR